ncbi:ATP-binding protein [Candidatus Saccharibacteria bacterium]|nr:ATP-binding protein [Candidatus Saccharibacteria bacterium]MCL1962766.1 ATP-binding protein [Candidatus Saccharibacteria bacterium]
MKKIVITGGPCTGKTTLINALKEKFPDAYFVEEPAAAVIARELDRAKIDANYAPIVPWAEYEKFVPLVVDESIKIESEIPRDAEVAFLDRSLIDNFVYFDINNFHEFDDMVRAKIADAHYDFALICEPVGMFEATDIRREDADQAAKLHQLTREVYEKSGLEIITIPFVTVPERVEIVAELLR